MAYVLPQVKVFQDFQAVPDIITDPLRAFIAGTNYSLRRYNVASEKALINLGTYTDGGMSATAIPGLVPGSTLDTSYTKVYIDDAWVEVLNKVDTGLVDASGTSIQFDINVTADYGSTLSSELNGRPLAVGDKVRVRTTNNPTQVLDTYIAGFVPTNSAASIAAATANSGNKSADSGNTVAGTGTATADNNTIPAHLYISSITTSSFNDLIGPDDLAVEFHYTFTVMSLYSSGNGAVIRVSNGVDPSEDYNVTFGGGTTVTLTDGDDSVMRSLSVTFTRGSTGYYWSVGDTYTLYANNATDYTVPTATSSGTYTGTVDTTYIVTCVTGGTTPTVFVTTDNGSDVNKTVSLTDDTNATLTTKGVSFKLNWGGAGLAAGDIWYVACTAAAPSSVSTIRIAKSLLSGQDEDTITVSVCVAQDIQLDDSYFVQDADAGTITLYDATTSFNGDPYAPVINGNVYVEHRSLLSDYTDRVYSIDDISEVTDTLGAVSPDNPLAQGVYNALLNANGTTVKYMAVTADDDLAAYSEVLEKLKERDDVYALVPLTQVKTIQDAFVAHCDSMSTAEAGRWRITFLNSAAPSEVQRGSNGTLDDDTNSEVVSSNSVSLLTDTDATFIDDGVTVGDTVRFYDGVGGYTESTITTVQDGENLILDDTENIGFAGTYAVFHTQSRTDVAEDYAAASGAFSNARAFHVWPDVASNGGVEMKGYHVCAALAGLVSGVVPQQGLTNVELLGFDDISRSSKFMNRTQLDTMADGGTYIVTQNSEGEVYTRHEISTDTTDINTLELMVTKNVDAISYSFLTSLRPLIGRSNVTPSAIALIHTQLASNISFLKSAGNINNVGPQLIEGTIEKLEAHPTLKDRVTAIINLEIPYPLNVLEVHLVI